jgi:hypothetical protein
MNCGNHGQLVQQNAASCFGLGLVGAVHLQMALMFLRGLTVNLNS